MATAEQNIKAQEMLIEELRYELIAAISEYEDAVEHPEDYDIELAEKTMNDAQRWYDEAVDELDSMKMWAAF